MPVNLRDPELQEKAREARKQRVLEGQKRYRRDFKDSSYWDDLAREYKIKLPMWHLGPTPGGMKKYLKKLAISREEYLEVSGEKSLKEFSAQNPDWPLRSWVGILLEYKKATEEMEKESEEGDRS